MCIVHDIKKETVRFKNVVLKKSMGMWEGKRTYVF